MPQAQDGVAEKTATRTLSPLFTWRSAICDSDLAPTFRHVALTLSLHMNERGGSCFPTHDQLKTETGLGRSTVIKALGELERLGWLLRTPGGGRQVGGNGRATEYRATVPQMDGSGADTVPLVDDTVPLVDDTVPLVDKNRPAAGHQDAKQDAIQDVNPLGAPPQIRLLEGRNLPFDALCEVCHIDQASPRTAQAATALNGRGGKGGIRDLYWLECVRYAAEHDAQERLAQLHADSELFAKALSDRIRRKAETIRSREAWRTSLAPSHVRDLWLDIELSPERGNGGMTPAEIAAYEPGA